MARQRKRVRLGAKLRALHPKCVYCGGGASMAQVDHVPPKAIFALKRRPEGLEFPACAPCHAGTRNMDAVAALTARSWPNLVTDEERAELAELMGGVLRNVPPVRDELARGFAAKEAIPDDILASVGADVIVMDFGVRRAILEAFGARVGLALHYQLTGKIVGEEGGVWVRAFTNIQNMRGEALPTELDGRLGPTLALMQKGLRAEEDFQVAQRALDDYGGTAAFASFRQSFAFLSVVYPSAADFPKPLHDDLFRPGFLIGYPL